MRLILYSSQLSSRLLNYLKVLRGTYQDAVFIAAKYDSCDVEWKEEVDNLVALALPTSPGSHKCWFNSVIYQHKSGCKHFFADSADNWK
jgi:hypothetical protein